MFDTIRLYQRGENECDFRLFIDGNYKKQVSEKNEVFRYYNTFESETGNKVYVEYDEMMKQGVNINFSAPLIANGSQLQPFKLSDYSKLLDNLHKTLSGKIDIDIENMSVSRLDITSNIITNNSAKDYISALSRSYINQRNYRTDIIKNETFTIHNKSRRFVFYDKITEMLSKGEKEKVTGSQKEERNILRFEIQNKRGRDVKGILKKDFILSELFQESVFLDCVSVQSDQFNRLFMNNKKQIDMFENDRQLIKQIFQEKGKKTLANRFLMKKQLDSGLLSFREIEELLSDYYTPRGMRKQLKEFRDLKFMTVDSQYSLLSEIENKIKQLYQLVA